MSIDREAALKKAEKLLRQGKLDGAIEEYVRLIEDQPRDWNAINALGDLYLRARNVERAVAQFTRVADDLFGEGFLPKSAALYKKALKVQPGHEHTLSQLGEIAARQGLSADARAYWRQLEQVRRQRGDELGAAECRDRLGALEETEAAVEAAPPGPAVAEREAPPSDDPGHLFALGQQELAEGHELQARALLTRVLTMDPGRHGEVTRIALDLARAGRLESAFGCIDVVTDAAVLAGDWTHAVDALQTFVGVASHIPALVKLVELCVDADLEAPLRSAQAQLADAYLDAGRGSEARVIAEDLLEQDPGSAAHAQRLQRALEVLKIASPAGTTAAEDVEIDLSDVLAAISTHDRPAVERADPYESALEHLRAGRVTEAIADLEAATQNPRTFVKAAGQLGRVHVRRGEVQAGVEWLERAADGPAATSEEGCAILYDLADALERLGEPARAMAVLIDLDSDAGEYRDVRARIEQLARTQTGSRGR